MHMTFNYRIGLFRVWLVLSLLWLAVGLFTGADAGAIITVPLIFGIVLYLIVWAIRGFALKQQPPGETVDLRELRQDLASTETEDPETFRRELEPLLGRLEAKYGHHVPVHEIQGLQQMVRTELGRIAQQKQEIIDQGAREGKTINLDRLRDTLEKSKSAYAGPEREAYAQEVDRLLESLAAKYGSRIPVDHAYRIMQRLEAGLGLSDDEPRT